MSSLDNLPCAIKQVPDKSQTLGLCSIPRDQELEPQKAHALAPARLFPSCAAQPSARTCISCRGPFFYSLLLLQSGDAIVEPPPRQKQALLYLAHNLLLQICCCHPTSKPRGPKQSLILSPTQTGISKAPRPITETATKRRGRVEKKIKEKEKGGVPKTNPEPLAHSLVSPSTSVYGLDF